MLLIDLHHRLQSIVQEFEFPQGLGREQNGDVENYLQYHWNHHLNPGAGFETSKTIERKLDTDRYAGGCRVPGPGDDSQVEVEVFTTFEFSFMNGFHFLISLLKSSECPICYLEVQIPKDPAICGGWGKIHRLRNCLHTYCQACIYTYLRTRTLSF